MAQIPSGKFLAKMMFIFGGAQVVTILATLVRSKVAALTIGSVGMGLSALFLSISGLMNNLFNLGLPDSGVQTLSKVCSAGDRQRINETIGLIRLWGVMTAVAAMLFTLITAPLLCKIYFHSFTSHLQEMMLLSLVPACTIIAALENAILKSLHRHRLLTYSIAVAAILTVLVSIPLYCFVGMDAIIHVIVITSVMVMLQTLFFSYKANSTVPTFKCFLKGEHSFIQTFRELWVKSRTMIMLGVALVITGVGSMGADLLIQMYITTVSTLTILGLYKVGYQFSITYPAMIFSAVTNDYYPRLASLENDIPSRNLLVTRQTIVLLTNVVPCIIVFIVVLPWIVPLLLSSEFLDIVPMIRIGVLSIIVRCLGLPVCFMPLALGKKWDFVIMELCSYTVFVLFVLLGFHFGALMGVAVAIVATNIFDYVYGICLCRYKYAFRYKFQNE